MPSLALLRLLIWQPCGLTNDLDNLLLRVADDSFRELEHLIRRQHARGEHFPLNLDDFFVEPPDDLVSELDRRGPEIVLPHVHRDLTLRHLDGRAFNRDIDLRLGQEDLGRIGHVDRDISLGNHHLRRLHVDLDRLLRGLNLVGVLHDDGLLGRLDMNVIQHLHWGHRRRRIDPVFNRHGPFRHFDMDVNVLQRRGLDRRFHMHLHRGGRRRGRLGKRVCRLNDDLALGHDDLGCTSVDGNGLLGGFDAILDVHFPFRDMDLGRLVMHRDVLLWQRDLAVHVHFALRHFNPWAFHLNVNLRLWEVHMGVDLTLRHDNLWPTLLQRELVLRKSNLILHPHFALRHGDRTVHSDGDLRLWKIHTVVDMNRLVGQRNRIVDVDVHLSLRHVDAIIDLYCALRHGNLRPVKMHLYCALGHFDGLRQRVMDVDLTLRNNDLGRIHVQRHHPFWYVNLIPDCYLRVIRH